MRAASLVARPAWPSERNSRAPGWTSHVPRPHQAIRSRGGLRGEDLLGEVLGSVGLGSRELGGYLSQRGPTLSAELLPGRVRRSTRGAGEAETATALATELLASGILVLAPGTSHAEPPACRAGGGQDSAANLSCGWQPVKRRGSPGGGGTAFQNRLPTRPHAGGVLPIAVVAPAC